MSKETSKTTKAILTASQKIKQQKRNVNLPKDFDIYLRRIHEFGKYLNTLPSEDVSKKEYLVFHGSMRDALSEVKGINSTDANFVRDILQGLHLIIFKKKNPATWYIRAVEEFKKVSTDAVLLSKFRKETLKELTTKARYSSMEMALDSSEGRNQRLQKELERVTSERDRAQAALKDIPADVVRPENGRVIPDGHVLVPKEKMAEIMKALQQVGGVEERLRKADVEAAKAKQEIAELKLERSQYGATPGDELLRSLAELQDGDDTSSEE